MRTDASRIQKKRVRYLIALGDLLTIGGAGVPAQEALINRVVDDFNAVRRYVEEPLDLAPRYVRNCEDARGAAQDAPGHLKVPGAPEARLLPRPGHMLEHVVYRHYVWARQYPGNRK